jgi:hypothetical protein
MELAAIDAATGIGGYKVAESDGAVIVMFPADEAPPVPTAMVSLNTRIPVLYPAATTAAALRHDVISVSRIIGCCVKRFAKRVPLQYEVFPDKMFQREDLCFEVNAKRRFGRVSCNLHISQIFFQVLLDFFYPKITVRSKNGKKDKHDYYNPAEDFHTPPRPLSGQK